MSSGSTTSPRQTLISVAVLVALAGIAAGVVLSKLAHSEGTDDSGDTGVDALAEAMAFVERLPDSLSRFGEVERYTAENLFVPINGRAESYISKGFVALGVQEFYLGGEPDAVVTLWVYDMGEATNAFAAFSTQRRPDAETLDLAEHAYASSGSVYLAHGRFYVEVDAAPDPPAAMADAARTLARGFVEGLAIGESGQLEGHSLLPEENRRPGSIQLIKSDAFGFAGLDNVWLARYDVDGVEATGYVSKRTDAAEAEQLALACIDLLISLGAEQDSGGSLLEPSGVWGGVLDGRYYYVFHAEHFVGGVHDCGDRDVVRGVTYQLYDHAWDLLEDD